MKTFEIRGGTGHSSIMVGESLANFPLYTEGKNILIITDANVCHYYRSQFPPQARVFEIGCSESVKTLTTVETIYQHMLDWEIDRSWFVVGIGGGIVCDITGFVASTYMRGLPFGFVASTLLAQVDASVGGKNGVNFHGYKNIIGVFQQPRFVICDLALINTLPPAELVNGLAEVVKHAAIADPALFSFLEEHHTQALQLHPDVLERLVYDSIVIKSAIVEKDETEQGQRRKLNFGHTFAHALEKSLGLPHGEAVGLGMVLAVKLAVKKKKLPPTDADRLTTLLVHLGLPVTVSVNRQQIHDAIRRDKKRDGENIHFILLDAIGSAVVEEIALADLEAALDDLCIYQ